MKKKTLPLSKFGRHRYRLTLTDEARMATLWSIKASRLRAALVVLLLLATGFGIGVLTVGFTPVKRQMPGYMTGKDRATTLQALMRIDSLQLALQQNQTFLDNLAGIIDTDRAPADSAAVADKPRADLSLDSLIGSSARERKFVAMMEESEKYNLKVLSPLAAEGMIWADPVPGAIVLEQSRTLPRLQLITPRSRGVAAMADGRVIDRAYDSPSQTWSLLIQHSQGFVSRISGTGRPLTDKGDPVVAGQMLTEPMPSSAKYLTVEMWRDGTPLIPADYIAKPRSDEEPQTIEAPRGR